MAPYTHCKAKKRDYSGSLSSKIIRVGQSHTCEVCIRYFWQGNHHVKIRCVYTLYINCSGQPYICRNLMTKHQFSLHSCLLPNRSTTFYHQADQQLAAPKQIHNCLSVTKLMHNCLSVTKQIHNCLSVTKQIHNCLSATRQIHNCLPPSRSTTGCSQADTQLSTTKQTHN